MIDPEPTTVVVSVKLCSSTAKLAITVLFAFIVICAGLAVPPRSPLQPMNVSPAAGVTVRVTTVPLA